MATNVERTVYLIELKDKFTRGMNKMQESTRRFNNSVATVKKKTDTLSKGFKSLGLVGVSAIAGVTAGMYKLASSAVTVSAKFETVQKAFEVLLGDKGLGSSLFGWAKEFSRSTIITFDQTVTSIRKLLAYGISEQNIRPLTEMLSTIAAGVGTDRLPYLTLALGQVKSRGRLMGTELRQFREHGVDIISELAKGMGVATPEVERMVTQGLISFDMVAKAMIGMTKEGGRFSGMLEEMAKTTTGLFNIMKSSWSIAMANIGDQLRPLLNRIMEAITPSLVTLSRVDFDYLGKEMDRFGDVLVRFKNLFTEKNVFRIIYEEMVTFVFNMTGIADKLTTEMEIFKRSMEQGSDLVTGFFDLLVQNALKNPAGIEKAQKNLEDIWTGQTEFAEKERDKLAIRLAKNRWDMQRQLRAPLTDPEDTSTGEYVPGSEVLGVTVPEKGKKTRTNRRVGTGARDIVINIGNLIENVTNNNQMYDKNVEAMQEQLRRALLTVVNDVTLMKE